MRLRRRGHLVTPVLLVALLCVIVADASPVHGRSLAGKLHRFIDTRGFPTFGEFIEVVTPIVQRLAVQGIDFPVISTSPAFSYRFDFQLGAPVPVRSADSLGSVFVERADTVGAQRFDLGLSYLYADLTRFEGDEFAHQILTAGVRKIGTANVAEGFAGRNFSLASHVLSLSGTYGLTDRWDVNALVPVVGTTLHLDGRSVAIGEVEGEKPLTEPAHLDANTVGIGDVLLRSKYRFGDVADLKLAMGLTLKLPTGNEQDFQGAGDTTVQPTLIVSRTFGRQDVHGTVGAEMNADDLERTRTRYALGVSLQPCEGIAFLVDVLGSSSFVDDEFAIPAPAGKVFPHTLFGNDELIRSRGRTEVVAFVPRSDVVDLAVGFRVSVGGTATAFASAIVPLTQDGLRAEVMPTAGIEVSF